MDGLMSDTETHHCTAWVRLLEEYGVKIDEKYFSQFVGSSTAENAKKLKLDFGIKTSPEELVLRRRDLYLEIINNEKLIPTSGLKEVFLTAEKRGLKNAVGTSSPMIEVEAVLVRVLKACDITVSAEKYFDVMVTADIVKKLKPSPEIYRKCVEKLGLKSEDCIVLEDSVSGVKAAKEAGLFCVAFKSRYSQHQDLSAADKVVSSLLEVVNIL